jgi:hypothetical protein
MWPLEEWLQRMFLKPSSIPSTLRHSCTCLKTSSGTQSPPFLTRIHGGALSTLKDLTTEIYLHLTRGLDLTRGGGPTPILRPTLRCHVELSRHATSSWCTQACPTGTGHFNKGISDASKLRHLTHPPTSSNLSKSHVLEFQTLEVRLH